MEDNEQNIKDQDGVLTYVHIFKHTLDKLYSIASENTDREIGGFLLGYTINVETEIHAVIVDFIVVPSTGTKFYVEFLTKGINEVVEKMKQYHKKGLKTLGWFHTHPGHHALPSYVDLRNHQIYFHEPYHFGLIIDPINKEVCIFSVYKNTYKLLPLAIWKIEDKEIRDLNNYIITQRPYPWDFTYYDIIEPQRYKDLAAKIGYRNLYFVKPLIYKHMFTMLIILFSILGALLLLYIIILSRIY